MVSCSCHAAGRWLIRVSPDAPSILIRIRGWASHARLGWLGPLGHTPPPRHTRPPTARTHARTLSRIRLITDGPEAGQCAVLEELGNGLRVALLVQQTCGAQQCGGVLAGVVHQDQRLRSGGGAGRGRAREGSCGLRTMGDDIVPDKDVRRMDGWPLMNLVVTVF